MKTESHVEPEILAAETKVARTVAGEDLQCGDFVTLLYQTSEIPAYLSMCEGFGHAPEEMLRIRHWPEQSGHPRKVIGICLPFVYVEAPDQEVQVFDVRRQELVRLDKSCAKLVWKRLQRGKNAGSSCPD